jgi:hypothetical protein
MTNLSAFLVVVLLSAGPSVSQLRDERNAVKAREEKALTALAAKLGGEAGAKIKAMIEPAPAADGSTHFVPLGEVIRDAEVIDNKDLKAIREAASKEFLALAMKCLPPNPTTHLALADECLRGVVLRDPSQSAAWRLLGYVPHKGGWATPFALGKINDGYVLHPIYGWVEASWVPHLNQGELPGVVSTGRPIRWLPTAQADALRQDFARGWQIRTAHFSIQTNVPLNEAIGFGRRLESLRELFMSMMADLISPELHPMALLAKNPKAVPTAPKETHRVFYFADREQYIAYLENSQGASIRDNIGTYLPKKETKSLGLKAGTSFFFRDPGGELDVTENLDHEVSHQLLFETAGADRYDPDRAHFWIFEGLGTYFETMRTLPDGSIRIGGWIGKRIAVAQERLTKNGEFVPIGRITTYNRSLFYGADGGDIRLHYAEAMALTVFFMQSQGNAYRETFLEYVRDVYKGKLRGGAGKTLDERLGTDFGSLARDFLAELKAAKPLEPLPAKVD